MLLTFMISISKNMWLTALIDSLYAFAFTFAAMYAFRWLLGTAAGLKQFGEHAAFPNPRQAAATGSQVDLTSEPDEDVNELIKSQIGGQQEVEFTPLNPPKFVSKNKLDPKLMADSIRQLSEGGEGER